MASIIMHIDVGTDVDAAWKKVSDVGGVTNLVSLISECRLDGDTRYCTMADGSKLTEQILSIDPTHRRLAYRITEGPMPIEFHCSTMQVFENGSGARIVWSVDIKPDELAPHLEPMMDSVAESIKATLA